MTEKKDKNIYEEINRIKMSRVEKRKEREKQKIKKRKDTINWFFYVIVGSISLTVLVFFYSMYSMYQKTVDWKKAPETKIADIPSYMLYLPLEEQEKVKQYNYIQSEIFDLSTGDFKQNANLENVDKLKELYDDLPKTLKERVKDNYTRITELYKIKENWSKLVENKEIKEKTTPQDISKFVEDNKDVIFKYLQQRTPKKFITELYQEILTVTKDVNVVNELLKIINEYYTFGKNKIEFKEDKSSDFIQQYDRLKRQLVNKWQIIFNYTDNIIFNSKKIIEKHDKAITDFEDFKKIISQKDDFDKWLKSYKETKDNLLDIPDLVGKTKDEVDNIVKDKLKVVYNEVEVTEEKDVNKVLKQRPTKESYDKIMSGSTIIVDVGIKKEERRDNSRDREEDTNRNNNSSNDNSSTNTNSRRVENENTTRNNNIVERRNNR